MDREIAACARRIASVAIANAAIATDEERTKEGGTSGKAIATTGIEIDIGAAGIAVNAIGNMIEITVDVATGFASKMKKAMFTADTAKKMMLKSPPGSPGGLILPGLLHRCQSMS